MRLKREHILRLTQIWILFLIVGSLQPVRPRLVVGLHREAHWLAFATAALLLLLLSRTRRQELHRVIAACLLGLSLECLQHLIYGNTMEWRDVRDDALAITLAFVLYRLSRTCKFAFLPPLHAESETANPAEVIGAPNILPCRQTGADIRNAPIS